MPGRSLGWPHRHYQNLMTLSDSSGGPGGGSTVNDPEAAETGHLGLEWSLPSRTRFQFTQARTAGANS